MLLNSLPPDVLELVLFWLDLQSLARVSQTCRQLSNLRWRRIDCRTLHDHWALSDEPRLNLAKVLEGVISKKPQIVFFPELMQPPLARAWPQVQALLACGSLREVDFGRQPKLSQRELQLLGHALAKNQGVRKITLRGNCGQNGGARGPTERAAMACGLYSLLDDCSRLTDLTVGMRLDSGDAAFGNFEVALPRVCHCLQTLQLECCRLGEAGVRVLTSALPETSVKKLVIFEGGTADVGAIGASGASVLADALASVERPWRLESLCLNGCGLRGEGIQIIAAALPVCPSLVDLSLRGDQIGPKGLKELCAGIAASNSLRMLALVNCNITCPGVEPLCEALNASSCMWSVNLAHNRIRDRGCNRIARYLGVNPALRHISLRNNLYGANGVRSLLDALQVNTHLDSLDVRTSARDDTFELQVRYPAECQSRIPGFPVLPGPQSASPVESQLGRRPRRSRAAAEAARRHNQRQYE